MAVYERLLQELDAMDSGCLNRISWRIDLTDAQIPRI